MIIPWGEAWFQVRDESLLLVGSDKVRVGKGRNWLRVRRLGCGDRVGWNREQFLCFHPTDPWVDDSVTKRRTQARFLWYSISNSGHFHAGTKGGTKLQLLFRKFISGEDRKFLNVQCYIGILCWQLGSRILVHSAFSEYI